MVFVSKIIFAVKIHGR